MTSNAWEVVVQQAEHACHPAGLDLVHPFAMSRYNVGALAEERLEDFGREASLGLLIANTRALWPAFTRAFQSDPALNTAPHPLNAYVEASVKALQLALHPLRSQSYFSYITHPRPVPMQRLAERVGFAAVSPSHLAIHPVHGPWFAFRAVVVVDVPGPVEPPRELVRPCQGCPAPCVPAFERASAISGERLTSSAVAQHAEAWIAVRDACPVGKASRYGEPQLRYHYTPDRSRLP